MPNYRMTSFYGQANTGWSETWYLIAGSLVAAARPMSVLNDIRSNLLTSLHTGLGVRVSQEGKNRKSRLFLPGVTNVDNSGEKFLVRPTGNYPEGQSPLLYDQVRVCMQLGLYKNGERISIRYLDGIPDAITKTESKTLDLGAELAWWGKFGEFTRTVISNGFAVKVQNREDNNPERNVIDWTLQQAGPSLLGFTIPIAQALAVPNPAGVGAPVEVGKGDKVQVRNVRMDRDGVKPPNGTWDVDSFTDNTGTGMRTYYLRRATGFDPADIKVLGKVKAVSYSYVVPDLITPIRAGVHKRGRPFGSPRGRARVKRYAA